MLPKVGIVLLNWNSFKDSQKCLQSLKKINYSNYQIYLVDNGSSNKEGEALKKEFPEIILIKNEKNEGFAKGNNIGIRKALGDGANYVLLLNTDTTVDPKFLSEMVKVGKTHLEAGVIGSKVFFMERPEKLIHFGLYLDVNNSKIVSDGFDGKDEDFKEVKEYDYVGGCCLLIKKETIDKVGLLDERFFAYFEESDWCFRVKEIGQKVLGAPKAKIWHKMPYPPIDKRGAFQNYLVTRNRLLFTRKRLKSGFLRYFFKSMPDYLFIPMLKSIEHLTLDSTLAYLLGYLDFVTNNYSQNNLKLFLK
ncbi:MAG: glycosyltransferase family 2 protein [Patescibacteria group bacterium]|nr:glycosyltransferase family 2 protein [Patescibacteria group bacterium]